MSQYHVYLEYMNAFVYYLQLWSWNSTNFEIMVTFCVKFWSVVGTRLPRVIKKRSSTCGLTQSREMSHLSKISISIFLHHFLKTSKCLILMQTPLQLDIWLQSYEGFDNAKNNMKQRNSNTVFANISKKHPRHPTHSSWSCHRWDASSAENWPGFSRVIISWYIFEWFALMYIIIWTQFKIWS